MLAVRRYTAAADASAMAEYSAFFLQALRRPRREMNRPKHIQISSCVFRLVVVVFCACFSSLVRLERL